MYVIGSSATNNIQLLTLNNSSWTVGPPLIERRTECSCSVNPIDANQVFVIGGLYYGQYLSSIEVILTDTDNVQMLNDELTEAASRTRAVAYDGLLYIFGGRWRNPYGDYQYLDGVF